MLKRKKNWGTLPDEKKRPYSFYKDYISKEHPNFNRLKQFGKKKKKKKKTNKINCLKNSWKRENSLLLFSSFPHKKKKNKQKKNPHA